MEKLRLLYCLETIGFGEPEKNVYDLAGRLEKDRFVQKVVCTHAFGELTDSLEDACMEVIDIGRFRSPFNIYRIQMILQVLKSYKPHVIIGIGPVGSKMAFAAGKLGRVPLVVFGAEQDYERFYQDLVGDKQTQRR